VLAAGLVGSASAQDVHWTGANGNDAWNNSHNWDTAVPSPTTVNTWLQIPAAMPTATVMTIPIGTTQNVGTSYIGDGVHYGTIFGPEWGMTLNIHGNLNYDWMMYPVGSPANPTTVNMDGNSSLSGVNLGIGNSWWFHGGPNVTMNVADNSTVNIAWLFWGGHVNLSGGTFNINGGVNEDVLDQVSDATRLMNITGGKLVLGFGDQTTLVNGWQSRGILQAYGGAGSIVIDTFSMPGKTVVTALVPEPSSLALLGIAGVTLIAIRRRFVFAR